MKNAMKTAVAATIGLAWMALSPDIGAQTCAASPDQQTITISAAGRMITFRINLPPSYASSPGRRYPVIYHLHGIDLTFESGQPIDNNYTTQMDKGDLAEAILVFPDGYFNAQWADSHPARPSKPAESDVIQEIRPWIASARSPLS
ncbi:MAG: alpha/beta hydrolase-fold protein, partial [Betaproteobacteria bacterium]